MAVIQGIQTVIWMVLLMTVFRRSCAQFLSGECPNNCKCSGLQQITIDCMGQKSFSIEKEINAYLQNHTDTTALNIYNSNVGDLKKLDISNLTKLTDLAFTNNSLITELPDTFLTNNTQLENIWMINSSLSQLSDGIFNGLQQIKSVNLNFNNISRIGLRTFLDLPKIEAVYLTNNSLSEVDIWPLYLLVTSGHEVKVEITKNKIDTFTNHLNWTYNCGMKPANGHYKLNSNRIKHIKDWTDGYNIHGDIPILCLFRNGKFHLSFVDNLLVCDCVDYEFYRFMEHSKKSETMNNLVCKTAPDKSLIGKNVVKIPLFEFVCDIHAGCPDRCNCFQEPYNKTFHINCQNKDLTILPDSLSSYKNMSEYRYKFNFQGNKLSSLDSKSYFGDLYTANFAHNNLQVIHPDVIEKLVNNSRYIYLDSNGLQHLPVEIQDISFDNVLRISLHSNPWACECASKWIVPWMKSIENKTSFPDGVLCASPSWLYKKNIFSLTQDELCTDPYEEKLKQIVIFTVSAVLGTLLFLVLPGTFIYVKRVWVYKKFKVHIFDWDECKGEQKEYDAFISYAEEDREWVRNLVSNLESEGYKLLIHHRDFEAGAAISVNVERAVDISKRTVCIMSRAFAESEVCKWEFDTALSLSIQNKKSRLIVIRLEDVLETTMPRSMYLYMKRHTYIDVNNEDFMDILHYSMPVHRLGSDQIQPGNSTQVSERTPLLT